MGWAGHLVPYSSKTFGVWLFKKAWEISCNLWECETRREIIKLTCTTKSWDLASLSFWCISICFCHKKENHALHMYMYNVLTSCQGFFVKLLPAQWLLRFLFSPSNHRKTSKIKRGYERIKIIHYNLFSS